MSTPHTPSRRYLTRTRIAFPEYQHPWSWATCSPVPISHIHEISSMAFRASFCLLACCFFTIQCNPSSQPSRSVTRQWRPSHSGTTFITNEGIAIPKHSCPVAEGCNPTAGLNLLWARNPFWWNSNYCQISQEKPDRQFPMTYEQNA